MREVEVEFLELGRENTLAREKEGVGHFAEEKAEGEGWRAEERGAVQGVGQEFGEVGVRDRLRGDDVERAGDVGVF